MSESSPINVVTVEIHGQQYPVRSHLAAAYVSALASYVDQKMRTAADETATGDSVKVAVLAALNIADEYFRCRDARDGACHEILRRAEEIEQLVDQTLAEAT